MSERAASPAPPPPAPAAGAPLPALLTALLAVAALAWSHRERFVDDAFIAFRFVENLRRGHGFVFNPGDAPVEGVTNLGWTLLLVPLAQVLPVALAAKIAGLASLIAGLYLLARLLPRGETDGVAAAAAPLLLAATCFDIVYFAVAGMETGLLFLIVAAFAVAAATRASPGLLGALGAAAFVVRPEAAAIPLLLAALRRDRRTAQAAVIAVALIILVTLARFAVFGDLLPQPARAKGSSLLVVLANLREIATGGRAHLPFPLVGLPALALAWLGWRRWRRTAPEAADAVAAIAVTGVAFVLYALPDWTELARYAAPYAPFLIVLAWSGLVGLVAPSRTVAGALVAGLVLVALLDNAAKTARGDGFPGYVVFGTALVEPARWIAANLPADAVIATRRIGAVAFHGDRRVFDYAVGLVDREVARLHAPPERGLEDPNDPRLAALWAQRRPTHLLEDDDVMERIARNAGGSPDGFRVHGETYRVIKSFELGPQRRWLLAERVAR